MSDWEKKVFNVIKEIKVLEEWRIRDYKNDEAYLPPSVILAKIFKLNLVIRKQSDKAKLFNILQDNLVSKIPML